VSLKLEVEVRKYQFQVVPDIVMMWMINTRLSVHDFGIPSFGFESGYGGGGEATFTTKIPLASKRELLEGINF
jgi:hypothetical protein